MAVTVLVLQPLPIQRGAPRGSAQEETPSLGITRGPGEITDALKAEHGVEDVKGHQGVLVYAVGGGCREPGGERPGLRDAFLKHLTIL